MAKVGPVNALDNDRTNFKSNKYYNFFQFKTSRPKVRILNTGTEATTKCVKVRINQVLVGLPWAFHQI